MRYLSVCSGIEAASVAWRGLGWKPVALSDIDAFSRAVLAYRFPDVPLHGDFTTIGASDYGAVELLVGGTPCQSFSFAGLRNGLDSDRGNLALEFIRLAWRVRPRWILWENVPGVLSSNKGRDFGAILGALEQLGYGWSYRVLDAQYFGVPQRRRRVFVVGHLGDWRRAAAILFERHSLQGNPSEGCKKRQTSTTNTCPSLDNESLIAFGWQNSASQGLSASAKLAPTLDASKIPAIVFTSHTKTQDTVLNNTGRTISPTPSKTIIRRLMPRECERLQGFPDDWTLVPYQGKLATDSPRYKAIGNSMAVPVMNWIGSRIASIDKIK
jgi:DNA (cytosine-5)-methyltransferase 1